MFEPSGCILSNEITPTFVISLSPKLTSPAKVALPVKKLNDDAANSRASLALLASFKADILKLPDASSNSKLWFVLVLR